MSDETLVSTFERLRSRLLGLAGRLLRDDEEAQDVLQDAFCQLWTHYRNVSSPKAIEALSMTTVRNLSISTLRHKIDAVDLEASSTACESDESIQEDPRDEKFNMVERLINEHLSPLQRSILTSREIEGKSIAEIAIEMKMEEPAVRMNLRRARKTIRELYTKTNSL